MKVLFIGGTGNISTAVSNRAIAQGIDLFLLNRGNAPSIVDGATTLRGDIADPGISSVLSKHTWDVVVDWIAFEEKDIQRDFRLFNRKTKQFVFISSASAYQKPLLHPVITESTPLENPYWLYSRNKIACEARLRMYHTEHGFPITIVRPSLTYNTVIPVPIGGWKEYTIVDRIKKGRKIIVHGDGSSLWTITHAEDFAKGIVGLFGQALAIGEAFHITSDEILTWDQIHNALASAAGCKADIVHIPSDVLARLDDRLFGSLVGDKATSVIFDNTKIKQLVPNFAATIPFAAGIKRTIAWFESDPARMIVRKETHEWMDSVINRFEKAFL